MSQGEKTQAVDLLAQRTAGWNVSSRTRNRCFRMVGMSSRSISGEMSRGLPPTPAELIQLDHASGTGARINNHR